MVSIPQVALRAWNFLWSLLALSLVSAAIAQAFAKGPASVNFAEFVAIISFIVALVGIGGAFVEALSGPIMAIADIIASILSFIAGVVLAAKLGVHSCGNTGYILTNDLTSRSHNPSKRCHELQAATAFFWFMFAGFAASAALGFMSGGSGLGGRSLGGRKGPSMSQV